MIDYHMHLERGPLSAEYIKEFWEHGKRRGISEIGFTEHIHRFLEFEPVFAHLREPGHGEEYMERWLQREFKDSIETYFSALQTARSQGIPAKIGLEVDYFPEQEEQLRLLLAPYELDFVIGSVHVLGQRGFDYAPEYGWDDASVDEKYIQYYGVLKRAVQSRLFDIIGHFDVIKVFGHRPTVSMDKYVGEVLEAMAQYGTVMEISTAGLRKPVGEMYPEEAILRQAAKLQIPITFSSDAHEPENVGYCWEDAVLMASRCGYREYRIFQQRRSHAEKLPKIQ